MILSIKWALYGERIIQHAMDSKIQNKTLLRILLLLL